MEKEQTKERKEKRRKEKGKQEIMNKEENKGV